MHIQGLFGAGWRNFFVFIAYMLDAACKRIGEIVSDKFHKYDFSQLAEYLMESDGHILHPKEGAEQSVMKALR